MRLKKGKKKEIEERLHVYVEKNTEYDGSVSFSVKNLSNGKIIMFFNNKDEVEDFIKILKEEE